MNTVHKELQVHGEPTGKPLCRCRLHTGDTLSLDLAKVDCNSCQVILKATRRLRMNQDEGSFLDPGLGLRTHGGGENNV